MNPPTETAAVAVAERQAAERRALFEVVREGAVAVVQSHIGGVAGTQPALGDEAIGLREHGVITSRHVVVQNEQRLQHDQLERHYAAESSENWAGSTNCQFSEYGQGLTTILNV